MTMVHFCADLAGVTPDETPQVMTGPEAVSTGPSMLLYAPLCSSVINYFMNLQGILFESSNCRKHVKAWSFWQFMNALLIVCWKKKTHRKLLFFINHFCTDA